jgi:hypothetical protein
MKTNRVSLHEQWLPYIHIIMNMSYYILLTNAFLGNGAKNVCWHFLTSLLELATPPRNTLTVVLNDHRMNPQAHVIVVVFHPEAGPSRQNLGPCTKL